MSQSASQAHKFYEEVAKNKVVWAAKIDADYLKFSVGEDKVSLPLWSSKSRIQRIKKLDPENYKDIEPIELNWDDFVETMAKELEELGHLIGVNLSGKNLVGYDRDVQGVINSVNSYEQVT